jgi:hypothetical protein
MGRTVNNEVSFILNIATDPPRRDDASILCLHLQSEYNHMVVNILTADVLMYQVRFGARQQERGNPMSLQLWDG